MVWSFRNGQSLWIVSGTIHENHTLTDVERFTYLKGLVRGAAAEAITGLSITAANYAEVVEVLNRRFGSKQRIIQEHMDKLLLLEAVRSCRNLRELYASCTTTLKETCAA